MRPRGFEIEMLLAGVREHQLLAEAKQDYTASLKHSENQTRASADAGSQRKSAFSEGPAIPACRPQLPGGRLRAL